MEVEIDIERLRKDLIEYFGTASMYNPVAIIYIAKIEKDYIPIYFDGKLAIKYTNLYIDDGLDIKVEMKDFLPKFPTISK